MKTLLRWASTLLVCLFATAAVADESPLSLHVIKTIKIGGPGGWDYLNVDPAMRRLYISRGDHVDVMDIDNDKVVRKIANTPGVHGIALAPHFKRGFTSNGRESTVTVFNLETLKESQRVKVGNHPDAIIYDPNSKRVFTFNAGDRSATAIDAETATVAGTVALGGKPEFAAADGRGHVFVNIENKDEIVAFDSNKLEMLHRWPVAPGEEPAGLAIDSEHHRLFCTCHNRKMIVLNCDNGKVVATPNIGRGTDAAAFDAANGLAFSSNGDGTLTVVKEETPNSFKVAANVKTLPGARTMALDTKTGQIYLVTARFRPRPAGERGQRPAGRRGRGFRPQFEPDSFIVIVVGK